jgi:hypothetical protein
MSTKPESETPFASPPVEDSPQDNGGKESAPFPRSTAMQLSPQLSSAALTKLLIAMCLLPIITITALLILMPPVAEGELLCQFASKDLPDQDFYAVEYWRRDKYELGELIVTNREEHDWTHLNIQVNSHYQIYDRDTIAAGTSKSYKLDRFVSRAGARFQLQYNPLKSARIYARRPKGDRATYYCEFKDGKPVEPSH